MGRLDTPPHAQRSPCNQSTPGGVLAQVHVADCHKHHWDFLVFHSFWNFFIIQGGEALVNIVCIGGAIMFPIFEANDTIDKMAELRGRVGTQMMLWERCLFSARTALQLITELQQLVCQFTSPHPPLSHTCARGARGPAPRASQAPGVPASLTAYAAHCTAPAAR